MSAGREGEDRVDILIVTAVKEEWDAILAVHTGAKPGSSWTSRPGATGAQVAYRNFTTEGVLRRAVVQAFGMGREQSVIAASPSSSDTLRSAASPCAASAPAGAATWRPAPTDTAEALRTAGLAVAIVSVERALTRMRARSLACADPAQLVPCANMRDSVLEQVIVLSLEARPRFSTLRRTHPSHRSAPCRP